ncbi:MAG: serine/threonine protein kinase, partial [Deltaproteobacteria bacterium]|nr:serine/threonine protein kinase [Deltaproteobacteria bacterium]
MTDKIATRFGPYRLLHQLGAGGMGQVFLATHEGEHGISRLVAIKRILAHLAADEKLVQLFLDEVRIAAQINHSNVVQVIDHGAIEGRYYMAMEYVHGENLADVLERLDSQDERMPVDIALHIASSVCEGLDHAHRKTSLDGKPLGIVHRDVSPHNVMLSFQGEVKIADFGIARAAEQQHETLGGELRGKISYMSPEQAYGKTLDRRSDLFSLGLVLYEVFTGSNPVARGAPLATLEAVRAVDIVPLATARPDLPPELHELIAQVLSPDVETRPDSARTLHDGLQRVMRMHSLVASPFDLADYLHDLFPEANDAAPGDLPRDQTDAGRRADEFSPPHDEDASPNNVHRTLLYQRQRRPGGGSLLLDPSSDATATSTRAHTQRPLPAWLIAILAAILAGGGVAVFTHLGTRSTNRADPRPHRVRPGATPDLRGNLASRPPRGDASPPATPNSPKDLAVHETSVPTRSRGQLRILSAPPRARVSLDGHTLSRRTPLTLTAPPGQHRIILNLDGYMPTHRTISLHPGSNP